MIHGGYLVIFRSGKRYLVMCGCGRFALITEEELRRNRHGCQRCADSANRRFQAKESEHVR